jgi:hypothetical protein
MWTMGQVWQLLIDLLSLGGVAHGAWTVVALVTRKLA